MGYEILDHTADVLIRVSGSTFGEFLKSSALAMMDLLTDRESVEPDVEEVFEITGETREELLVRMLSEILYLHHVHKLVFKDIELDIQGGDTITGTIKGEKFDPAKHELDLDIKAVTYHNLKIARVDDKFIADIVFDI